jgi:adenylate cyclase
MPRPARRCVRSGRTSAATPSRRWANICRATSPRRSCAIPKKLSLTGEKRALYTLFTDIEGFTELSHKLPPERVAALLNAYLDGMCDIVLDHGGTIDKFVGDAVVAFWGAPIARPTTPTARRRAAGDDRFTQNFSAEHNEPGAEFGRTRAGLHYGDAVVGNFGGEGRLSYTALGDAMNCAARLEGANKYLKTVALVSDEARSGRPRSTSSGRWAGSSCRAAPRRSWCGSRRPISIPSDRAELVRLWDAYDQGDRSALDAIEQICLTQDKDAALSAFACRFGRRDRGARRAQGEMTWPACC